ncbi:L-histidine N(alpha)-methyltransferase [Niabella ginsengisoli]|uniref:L-histidine N(Alpha)-methyltransferase n=1 Tax=Niabella ginsengisoli TaxID=522298 RepID=A0ABS9SKJ3_9BACT|nr:L-histidine N(alpha)-methyltransferase [Niabella ginsengisoli]MCH5598903.1 L-histidine N(alpha)-methyltransferase [Niabella ginsengisoli]
MTEQFKKDVYTGLNTPNKRLPSKYFYDKKGDALFVEIMNLPEYYLTRAEMDIFENQTDDIIKALQISPDCYFELIELGAGDGSKTKKLLQMLHQQGFKFDYFPVDISQNALDNLEADLKTELPGVSVIKKQGDYFEILASLKEIKKLKVILFLGSNIGNMPDEVATQFIYDLGSNLHPGDKLLLGADLIKPASIVLPAYNDSKGVTAAFNYNLLARINRELEADFDITNFRHEPEYTEQDGIAKSFLVSQADQTVCIKSIGQSFDFKKGERIETEVSRKYNDEVIHKIISETDFKISYKLSDGKKYFANYILERT